ncbi:cell division control protein 48 homolog C-like [Salvia splendens]|uniref:cell division control protein 48 homolog C-like n=1 Tax=Salvia splendens TaxID=180675 RepID=UPI001C25FB64|nr:cell division control protein 48 homolog C-like [Salvia splendens]XP_042064159.1 cell division control protein 48 homolog C-like [Salvia splendens]
MGRRRGGGSSGKLHSNNDRILRRHIESAGKNYSTVDELVDHLRSSYPHYSRHKLRPFTKQVERVIAVHDMDHSNDSDTPILNKRRKIDDKEQELLQIEAEHLRRQSSDAIDGCSLSSLASPYSSGVGSSFNEEASEDPVYGEKVEPEFDLMKSMLREGLRRKSEKHGVGRAVYKESIELEVVDNKGMKEVNLMTEQSKLGHDVNRNDSKNVNKNQSNHIGGKDWDVITEAMFKDLGGISEVIEELKTGVILSLCQPHVDHHVGVKPMGGILLHGPPGCGKTKLAHAIANETGVPFYKIGATQLLSGVAGESEGNIRELFRKAYRTAPSIVFIDEIDAIASKRENLQREMEKRIVTQLMISMDESHVPVEPAGNDATSASSNSRPGYVLVIGATNRPDAIDPALRRPGRFDREIALGVPNEAARIEILSMQTRNLRLEGAFDFKKIARLTSGFTGADLTAIADMAGHLAKKRFASKKRDEFSKEEKDEDHSEDWWKLLWSDEELENLFVTMADFEDAAKTVQPSLRREGFSGVPNVNWDDVGGLHFLREEFDHHIVRRIKFREAYQAFGLDLATCFLLYGPPGCGKTLIAKAVANEAGANFIHIKGPELLSKYVGETELAVRTIFSRARTCSPCIIFFDEVDALTTKRGREGGWVVERPLTQLLIEMDGSEPRRDVYVIGATNRPEVMDEAMLRPGRFEKLMYVPLPSPDERGMILKALARNLPIDANVDLMALAKHSGCDKFSGADLLSLMHGAGTAAVREQLSSMDTISSIQSTIKETHFMSALAKISPSVSEEKIQEYERFLEKFKAQ